VLSIDKDSDSVYAAKITTTKLHQSWAYKLVKGDTLTTRGRIMKDSWINLRRREIIPMPDVKHNAATLKQEVLDAILLNFEQLAKPFKNPE
jgi:hypothetical protein